MLGMEVVRRRNRSESDSSSSSWTDDISVSGVRRMPAIVLRVGCFRACSLGSWWMEMRSGNIASSVLFLLTVFVSSSSTTAFLLESLSSDDRRRGASAANGVPSRSNDGLLFRVTLRGSILGEGSVRRGETHNKRFAVFR